MCPLDVINTRFQVHGLPKVGKGNSKGNFIIEGLGFEFNIQQYNHRFKSSKIIGGDAS